MRFISEYTYLPMIITVFVCTLPARQCDVFVITVFVDL